MENPKLKFGEIDRLVSEIEESYEKFLRGGAERILSVVDSLCAEVDQALESRKREVSEWPLGRKRKEAADGADPFVLNLLSMDENFNVRTLAFCNPNIPENSMRRVLEEAPDYLRMVIANNPSTPSDVLDRIVDLTNEPEVLDAVQRHPNVTEVTKYKIESKTA